MKQTVEQIIQDLKNNKDHHLFKEQLEIIERDELKFRKGLIKSEVNKTKRLFNDQLTRGIGSVVSFIFAIIWICLVLPFRILKIIVMMIKLPFQCKEHDKLVELVKQHPEFEKLKKGGKL
jgi:hypothetical protein